MSSFTIREELDALVVCISDPDALNDFRSNSFRDAIYDAVMNSDPKRVALDIGRVDFLSSTGVAIIVGLKRRIEARQGKLVVFSVQPVVQDLFRITRLTRYFTFADDESDALRQLGPLPAV
jgi:anti-sigma B factor antagonist